MGGQTGRPTRREAAAFKAALAAMQQVSGR